MQKPITAIFYGISGAGKGTQAELLTRYLELEAPEQAPVLYIETGELARGFARAEGYTNKLVENVMKEGGLFPPFMPIYLWASLLVERFNDTQHVICDGVARRVDEVPILDSALGFYGRNDYVVFVLDLDDDTARERLESRGRGDDKSQGDAIAHRLAWYHDEVEPCIELYKKLGRTVHHIDGSQSIEDIHKEIRSLLQLS